MKLLLSIVAALVTVVVVASAVTAYLGWQRFNAPGPLESDVVVIVPEGAGVMRIAEKLEAEGVIEQPMIFALGARVMKADRALQAGEFAFPAGVSPRGAVEVLVRGERVVRRVTIPEGLTSGEILALLKDVDGLDGTLPDEPPAEGSLLPETYHFHYGDSRSEILDRMREAMRESLDELWPNRAENLPVKSREEAVVLASIVEKETAVAEERPLVASVFINRLDKGMRLQSDPTVTYALTQANGPLERELTRQDWKFDHPYNTYIYAGLPPGPIANPGRASLLAVMNPADSDYLYFVADGSGGHAFAKTLEEHNRNVANWKRHKRQQSQ
jgi:UPF0755 protein